MAFDSNLDTKRDVLTPQRFHVAEDFWEANQHLVPRFDTLGEQQSRVACEKHLPECKMDSNSFLFSAFNAGAIDQAFNKQREQYSENTIKTVDQQLQAFVSGESATFTRRGKS